MGKKDILTKRYLAQNSIFADAFNYYLFNGEKVIKPKDLKEQDSTELAVIQKMSKVFANQKMRDVLKLCTIKHSKMATFVLLGIEAQSNVHYAMPVRDYLYDALNYSSQVEAIRKKHEKDDDLSGDERLSGFSKNDRIVPVITLCICFDKKKWDGPRALFDMFGDVDPRIREYVDDYKLNLITPAEVDDFRKFNSPLRMVMEIIHASDDKKKLRDIINSRDEYKSVDIDTVEMINIYTSANISVCESEGGRINMCQAIEDIKEEGRAEGIKEGIKEGTDLINQLITVLMEAGRTDDLARAAKDPEYQKKLIRELIDKDYK